MTVRAEQSAALDWRENGLFDVPTGIVDGTVFADVVADAHERVADAKPVDDRRPGIRFYRDGTMQSRQSCASVMGGEPMARLAQAPELRQFVMEATGIRTLVPVRFGYKIYRRDDFLGVHRDNVRCTVTLTFGITDNLGQMGYMPEWRNHDNDELRQELADDVLFPEGGREMSVEHARLKGFDGHNIPHWRLPFEHELGILGTVGYFDLS